MKGTDNPNSEAEGRGRLFSVLDRGLTYVLQKHKHGQRGLHEKDNVGEW